MNLTNMTFYMIKLYFFKGNVNFFKEKKTKTHVLLNTYLF
jgi:hypothetical protein